MSLRARYLARQFARPSGPVGRWLIAPWLDRISATMNRLVLDELDVQPDDRVLEIGFGGGGLLGSILAATRNWVTGVDVSADMVRRARRRFRDERRLALHVASVEALPLADGSVDKACSVNNLYFWPAPEKGMAELARVLRPGGRLVLAFEPPEELARWPGHRFGFRAYEVEEAEALMRAAGFEDLRRREGRGRKPHRFVCLTGERAAPKDQE